MTDSSNSAYIIGPILGSLSFVFSLSTLVLYSWGQKGANMKGNKNPYTMLTLGLLLLKIIISIHLFISYFKIKENSLLWQLEGLVSIFVIFTTAGYYFSLSHLVLKASIVFNPGELKSKNYHIYSIVFGITSTTFALILNDVGITSFEEWGTSKGSYHEFTYGIMIFIIWPYITLSAFILAMKWRKEKLVASQKNLFLIHILAVITFSVSFMPFILVHFLSFSIPSAAGFTANSSALSFKFFALAMFCLSGVIFWIFRLFFCYSLRSIIKNLKYRTFKCDNRFDYFLNESSDSGDEVRLSSMSGDKKESISKKTKSSHNDNEIDPFGNTFTNLTNRETFNNLIGTYSAITIIIKSIYEKYYIDPQFAEMVDNLSSHNYSYPAWATDKVRQFFKLSELPKNISDDFNAFMDTGHSNDLEWEVTEYASALFQNIRTVNSLSDESLYNSLNPRANKKILMKSFEKTSAKGGKPLIKTHDKRFLIKEISEGERDFFLSLIKDYHHHLNTNPRSLLAKIYGWFSIRVNNKNKVFHILMENLDSIDDDFILFKYDMKFSTVNRKEISSNAQIRSIKRTFMKQMPWAKELFDYKEEINAYYGPKSRSSGGYKVPHSKNSLNRIEERSLEGSDEEAENGDTIEETKDGSRKIKEDAEYFNDQNEEKEVEEELETSPIAKLSSIEEDKIFMRISSTTKRSKVINSYKMGSKSNYTRGSLNSSSNYEDDGELPDQSVMKKLGLLKDEDFLRMHKSLFINADSKMELEMMYSSLDKDAKFLTDLNIMDYSLFIVVIQAPNEDPYMRVSKDSHQESDTDEEIEPDGNSSSFTEKQANLTKAIASMISGNKYVLYSRKRNFIYLVGLIDYLQKYIRKKKLERLGKQLVAFNNLNEGDTDFSWQPPEQYFQRFMDKVTEVFILSEQDKTKDESDTETEGYWRKRFML